MASLYETFKVLLYTVSCADMLNDSNKKIKESPEIIIGFLISMIMLWSVNVFNQQTNMVIQIENY